MELQQHDLMGHAPDEPAPDLPSYFACPKCGGRLTVHRTYSGRELITRRRKCISCSQIFTTTEQILTGAENSRLTDLARQLLKGVRYIKNYANDLEFFAETNSITSLNNEN